MPNQPPKKNVMWGTVLVLVFFLCSCAPTRTVYIPREWQQAPPGPNTAASPKPNAQTQTQSQAQAQAPAPSQSQTTTSSQRFVLKRTPAIKESEVPTAEESRPAATEKKPAQPQHMASMHLVDQANAALAQGKTDSAISLFEQAVQLDVYNGSAFFGLAKAWRIKGSREKALEFARKAEILFQDDRSKLKELYLLEANIFKDMGDRAKEEDYRQKASRLSDGKPGK